MSGDRLHEVAPGVLVATSRFMATNTVVVTASDASADSGALVIDPGVHEDELSELAAELRERRLRVLGGFATHAHWDHVLWHEELGDAPRWASPRTTADADAGHRELVREALAATPVDEARLGRLRPVESTVPWEGPGAHLVVHDGHCAGHTALHVPERGLLVAGDMGSDLEIPLLRDDAPGPRALLDHHEGLDRLAALAPVDVVVTGHGHVCDGAAWRRRVDADRRYLDRLAAGWEREDPRLVEPWLRDADRTMQDALTKAHWRRWARALPAPGRRAAPVLDGLADFLGSRRGTVVGAYVALPDEVDLGDLLTADDDVALPRLGHDGTVSWHADVGGRELHHLGLSQPLEAAPPVDPRELDVLLVPGRLFDRHGIRLGRGGGHYDRLVPHLRRGVPVVGVTVEERIVPRLPTEPHDAPMTHLATESGVSAVG